VLFILNGISVALVEVTPRHSAVIYR